MSASNRISSLVRTTERLGSIVAGENAALNSRKPQTLINTQEEKDRLTADYERDMSALQRNPAALKRASPDEVNRLRAAVKKFQEVLEEHRRLVQTAKSITDRMIKSITEEVANRDRPFSGYDAQATMRSHFDRKHEPVSLALDQVV